jgi:hypothetical protein
MRCTKLRPSCAERRVRYLPGCAEQHAQTQLAQIRNRLLRQTIAQKFLLGVVAQILTSSNAVFILADLTKVSALRCRR